MQVRTQNRTWIFGVVFGFFLAIGLIVFGCKNLPKQPVNPAPQLQQVQTEIKEVGKSLSETTKDIKSNATSGQKATPATIRPVLDPFWMNILLATSKQEVLVLDLQAKDQQLSQSVKQVQDLKTYGEQQFTRATKAESDLTSQLRRNLNLLVMAGIVGIAVAGLLIVTGQPLGMGLGVFSALLTGVSLFVGSTVVLIPWIVGGIVVLGVGYMAYEYITKKKKVSDLTTIGKELVHTVENSKQLMTTEGRKKLFGDGAIVGLAHMIQSDNTQTFVDAARKDIENAPPMPIKPTVDTNGDGVIDERDLWPSSVSFGTR